MFGTSSSSRSYQAALRDLSDESGAVRAAATTDLAQYGADHREVVVGRLLEALRDGDARVRAAAALALADVEAAEAAAELIEATEDDHEQVRQMALAALGELRVEDAVAAIERALQADSPAERFQAVMAFPRACPDHQRSVRVLLAATRDEDPLVRRIALRMAEELGSAEPADAADDEAVDEPFLRRAAQLLDDEDGAVQVAAAVILGRGGRQDGAEQLVAVAHRELITREAEDEGEALELCGILGLREAIPGLQRRAFDRVLLLRNDPFAWQARVALAALGERRAVAWVLAELQAWTRERRSLACAAAARSRLQDARPLVEAMRGDPARADQDAVEEALAALDVGAARASEP